MPSPRAGMIGVSDGFIVYSFGGKPGPGVEFQDMWIFDGSTWTDITPVGTLPPARDWYAACYDTSRGVYVLFGGRSSALGVNLGDTWEFNGVTWAQAAPAASPSARRWGAMAFDPVAGHSVLFGGFDGGLYDNETWSWDGTNWTLLAPTTSPSPRARGRLSYDSTSGEMVYFGGRATSAFGDTWVWDGSNWSQTITANAPSSSGVAGRFAYGMTYDLLRDRHVLFGGTRNGPTLGDVWEFDGTDWEQRSVSGPAGRTGPCFVYSEGLAKSFAFGGFSSTQLDDTWEFQTAAVASISPYGPGCAGSVGPLVLTSTTLPWTGDTWQATCGPMGATSLGLAVWGVNQTSLPLNPVLPIAPVGCNLLASSDSLVGPSLPSAGEVTVTFVVPNNPAVAGIALQLQVAELEFDLGGNWVGLYTSNGMTMTVGVR